MRVKMLRRLICMVSRLSGGRKNSTFSSSPSSALKNASSCCLLAGGDLSALGERQPGAGELEPFIGDDHHGLPEIERGEGRIDRQGDDAVGERDLVVLQADALAAEQDADGLAGRDPRRREPRRLAGVDHRLGLVVRPRRGRQHQRAVGDRLLQRVVEHRLVEDAVGARRHLARLRIGPFLPRLDQPQPAQPEIRHGARRRADVLAHLRLDQDHHRPRLLHPSLVLSVPAPGMQCSSAGKCPEGAAPAQAGRLRQAAAPYPARNSPAAPIPRLLTRLLPAECGCYRARAELPSVGFPVGGLRAENNSFEGPREKPSPRPSMVSFRSAQTSTATRGASMSNLEIDMDQGR